MGHAGHDNTDRLYKDSERGDNSYETHENITKSGKYNKMLDMSHNRSTPNQKRQSIPFLIQRTPMGDYIVPPGGKPLTRLGEDMPGPTTYLPNHAVVQYTAPEWSIPNRRAHRPLSNEMETARRHCKNKPDVFCYICGEYTIVPNKNTGTDEDIPAPNAYHILDEVVWPNRNFTLKPKLKDNREVVGGACLAGPAAYKVTGHSVGKTGFKFSIPHAKRDSAPTGLQSRLVQPQDSQGFDTPAPNNYEVQTPDLPHSYAATIISKPAEKQTYGPAPCDYKPILPSAVTGKSFGLFIDNNYQTPGPGPNTYKIGTNMGKGPAYSICLPQKYIEPFHAPSPTAYMIERQYSHKEEIAMHCRLPTPEPEVRPAPNTYKLSKSVCTQLGPKLKGRVKASYPIVLHSAFADCPVAKGSPGPAAHGILRDPVSNINRGAHFGRPFVTLTDGVKPGPNQYEVVDCNMMSNKRRAPSYSLGARLRPPASRKPRPGPADYDSVMPEHKLGITFKRKYAPIRHGLKMPGPNSYYPPDSMTYKGGNTSIGIRMKSRASPWVFSGFTRKMLYARSE